MYTGNSDHLQLEFDSDEIVDNWDNTSTFWERFHNEIDINDKNGMIIDKRYAIVLGLLGVDAGHTNFSAELHPVYGMFIHTKDNPTDDKWSFFIRNFGE